MILFTDYAKKEIIRRNINIALVEKTLQTPDQFFQDEGNIWVYQSKVDIGEEKLYLLRIFVAEDEPKRVITLYLTSKINKYWRE
ncbi:MAG: hypothetical protein SFU91_00100 [Chloroherpetonaceae bacterium]|nr:hypothetical protein [Chloroherpetonaceae bacterium]